MEVKPNQRKKRKETGKPMSLEEALEYLKGVMLKMGLPYICYVFEQDPEKGRGNIMYRTDVKVQDALVAIQQIVKEFPVNKVLLVKALFPEEKV